MSVPTNKSININCCSYFNETNLVTLGTKYVYYHCMLYQNNIERPFIDCYFRIKCTTYLKIGFRFKTFPCYRYIKMKVRSRNWYIKGCDWRIGILIILVAMVDFKWRFFSIFCRTENAKKKVTDILSLSINTGPLMIEPYRLDAPSRKQNHQLPQQDTASAKIQVQNCLQPA